jgi:hypothetical protein
MTILDFRGTYPGAEEGWPASRLIRRPGVVVDWRLRGYRVALSAAGAAYFVGSTRSLTEANNLADRAAAVLAELRSRRPDLFKRR